MDAISQAVAAGWRIEWSENGWRVVRPDGGLAGGASKRLAGEIANRQAATVCLEDDNAYSEWLSTLPGFPEGQPPETAIDRCTGLVGALRPMANGLAEMVCGKPEAPIVLVAHEADMADIPPDARLWDVTFETDSGPLSAQIGAPGDALAEHAARAIAAWAPRDTIRHVLGLAAVPRAATLPVPGP